MIWLALALATETVVPHPIGPAVPRVMGVAHTPSGPLLVMHGGERASRWPVHWTQGDILHIADWDGDGTDELFRDVHGQIDIRSITDDRAPFPATTASEDLLRTAQLDTDPELELLVLSEPDQASATLWVHNHC